MFAEACATELRAYEKAQACRTELWAYEKAKACSTELRAYEKAQKQHLTDIAFAPCGMIKGWSAELTNAALPSDTVR